MALVTLNLYTQPADVMDWLGVDGTQLRLDDSLKGTGQKIQATATAAILATSLSITALAYPLLKGTVLEFSGAGMPAVSEVTLTATMPVGSTSLTVSALAAEIPVLADATDAGVNLALAARLVKACNYGTSQVKLYCCSRYNDSDLQTCWSANRWSTIAAAKWLCTRRAQGCPQSILADWEEALDEMKMVRTGALQLEDIGTRTAGWPFLTNVTVDIGWTVAKTRVEQQISEHTPTQYGQWIDWNSALLLEW